MKVNASKIVMLFLALFAFVGNKAAYAKDHVATEVSRDFPSVPITRIAVFPLEGDFTDATGDAIITELMGMGYEVVERNSLFSALKEMKMSYSGFFAPTQRKEVSRFLNADAMLFGSVSTTSTGRIYLAGLRLVEIATGKVLWSMTYERESSDEPFDTMSKISASLRAALSKPSVTDLGSRNDSSPWLRIAQNAALPVKKYKRVALLNLSGGLRKGEPEALYSAILTGLLRYGVDVVERKSMEDLLAEQKASAAGVYLQTRAQGESGYTTVASPGVVSQSPQLAAKEFSEMGRLIGADAFLVGSFYSVPDDPFKVSYANLRLIDLERGKIAWSASYYNSINVGAEAITVSGDWLALALSPAITTDTPADYATKCQQVIERKITSGDSIIEKVVPRSGR